VEGGAESRVEVVAPGVYELATHPRHERHSLELHASPGMRVHAISFAAGLA
jgi:hypothetical protein